MCLSNFCWSLSIRNYFIFLFVCLILSAYCLRFIVFFVFESVRTFFTYLYIFLSFLLSFSQYLSISALYLCRYLSVFLSFCLSVFLSFCLSVCMSIYFAPFEWQWAWCDYAFVCLVEQFELMAYIQDILPILKEIS
jgi:hypothetical protein